MQSSKSPTQLQAQKTGETEVSPVYLLLSFCVMSLLALIHPT